LPWDAPAPALQYRDISAWQAELDRQDVFAAQRAYWLAKLSGVAPAHLPTDRPRPPEPSFSGAAVTLTLPADTVATLHRFARGHRTGLFSVLVAAVNAMIYRYTAGEDVVVGCVVAGRTAPELEDQVGFHVNTLPLRNRVSANASLDSLLSEVARTAADAFTHQEYPFDRLLAELPGRGPEPLFDVVVDYHENDDQENGGQKDNGQKDNGEDAAGGFGGLRLSPFAGRPPVAKFDLLFLCVRDRGALRVTLEYATDLFGPARVAGMAGHFRQILDAMLTAPERPIIELPLSGPVAPTPATPDDALEQFDFAEHDP
jgi:non-ribosomal peptide synthetase component F